MAAKKEAAAPKEAQLKISYDTFRTWIVGDTPLITHAWSMKAKRQMLDTQLKVVKPRGRPKREPHQDFVDSLYDCGDGTFGFPATGVKNCMLSAAHKDRGIARTEAMGALFIVSEMVRVRTAFEDAICDMPLVRIYGGSPVMREDMVKVGKGLNKSADLAYRGQFTVWAILVRGRYDASVLSEATLSFMIQRSGMASGLGEWRNERKGMFGAFHQADPEEAAAWDAYKRAWEDFKAGKGEEPAVPIPSSYLEAAE